jgi:hypothetical protein
VTPAGSARKAAKAAIDYLQRGADERDHKALKKDFGFVRF